ncbi:hypothetical protein FB45DRAFT_865229 [Roridomyces roridus]|uniref:Uncharacterized protein n=1 Tax=Roridomyces roridus TaxID=1738132 RepID=A0AAD7BYQ2_9AGAR|nr:hypothetical protein FB45DRAFT_865229 [Roridomyces roridus]
MNDPEKLSDPGTPDTPVHRPSTRQFDFWEFGSKLRGWPLIVIGGQLLLHGAAWAFFASVQVHGSIPVGHSTAIWIRDVGTHPVTLVFTQIATLLAACSSFFFTWGVRESIALHLHQEGMSLSTYSESVKISARGLVFDHRKPRWVLISIVVFVLTGVQTSCFSTLITPGPITRKTPLVGSELDLSSALLANWDNDTALTYCVSGISHRFAFIGGEIESGYTGAKNSMNIPSSLTFMDWTFNSTTAGVLPSSLSNVEAVSWLKGDSPFLPANIQHVGFVPNSNGLSSSYSLEQQGFTTDVSCQFQTLTNTTTPAAIRTSDEVESWGGDADLTLLGYSGLSVHCPAPDQLNESYTFHAPQGDYVVMSVCQSGANYSLIFSTGGVYDFLDNAVCTITPWITRVNVEYSDGEITSASISPNRTGSGAVLDSVGGPAGRSAVNIIHSLIWNSQSTGSNVMGDQLYSLVNASQAQDDKLLSVLEEYVRGAAEYSGSVLRACASAKNSAFLLDDTGIPTNMTTPTTGTFNVQTYGWTHASATTFWVLIPGTLVALLTIAIVLATVRAHNGDRAEAYFNPANPIHVMGASATGGLGDIFVGHGGKQLTGVEDVKVVLSSVPGQLPAFARSSV